MNMFQCPSQEGKTALDLALQYGKTDVVAVLREPDNLQVEVEVEVGVEVAEEEAEAEKVGLPIDLYEEYRNLDNDIFTYQSYEREKLLTKQFEEAKEIQNVSLIKDLSMKIKAEASARILRYPGLTDVSAISRVSREKLIERIKEFVSAHNKILFERLNIFVFLMHLFNFLKYLYVRDF